MTATNSTRNVNYNCEINTYTTVKVLSRDQVFVGKFIKAIDENIASRNLSVDFLSQELGVSKAQLLRKVSSLVGCNTNKFIRDYRLRRAADLLRQRSGNVSEVAYQVGFENLSYFAKVFKEAYHVSPSDYK